MMIKRLLECMNGRFPCFMVILNDNKNYCLLQR